MLPASGRHAGECQDVTVTGSVIGSHSAAFDTHGEGIRIHFKDCRDIFPNTLWETSINLPEGFQDRAQNTRFTNCEVIGAKFAFLLDPSTGSNDSNIIMRNITITDCTYGIDFRSAGITGQLILDGLYAENISNFCVQLRNGVQSSLRGLNFTGTQPTANGMIRLYGDTDTMISDVYVTHTNSALAVMESISSETNIKVNLDNIRIVGTIGGIFYPSSDINVVAGTNINADSTTVLVNGTAANNVLWSLSNVDGVISSIVGEEFQFNSFMTTGSGNTNTINVHVPVYNNFRGGYTIEILGGNKSGSTSIDPYAKFILSATSVASTPAWGVQVLEDKPTTYQDTRWVLGSITESSGTVTVPVVLLAKTQVNS